LGLHLGAAGRYRLVAEVTNFTKSMTNEKLMRFLWDGGWCSDIGRVSVFTNKYLPWRSRWETHRRTVRWILSFAKQVVCWHPQRVFNGAGSFSFDPQKASKFLPSCYLCWKEVPVIRHNFQCVRRRKYSYRIVPDFQKLDTLRREGNQ
jgi:hypothetical protein